VPAAENLPMGILSVPSSPPRRSPRLARWGSWFLVAALSGCYFLPLDGSIRIQGSIVSQSGEPVGDCTLYLLYPTGRERKQKVEPVFSTTFTISPPARDYKLKISCPGHSEPYVSKSFPRSGAEGEPPIDLGVIVMN
jgi:hypothetical protein